MRSGSGPWIALAGLFVGAGLAIGLAVGLRREPPPQVAAPVAAPASPIVDDAAVARTARAALEPQRLAWRKACWDPIVARAPSPPSSHHPISLSFDATGKEIMRAVNEDRARTRMDVALCLREQSYAPTTIAPPGRNVNVVIEIAFP